MANVLTGRIFEVWENGEMIAYGNYLKLAKLFGVSRNTIRRWAHVQCNRPYAFFDVTDELEYTVYYGGLENSLSMTGTKEEILEAFDITESTFRVTLFRSKNSAGVKNENKRQIEKQIYLTDYRAIEEDEQ